MIFNHGLNEWKYMQSIISIHAYIHYSVDISQAYFRISHNKED